MSEWLFTRVIYLAILLITTIFVWSFYKQQREAERYLTYLLTATFFFETLAVVFAYAFKNSSIVYLIFNPIQIILLGSFYACILEKGGGGKWARVLVITGAALVILTGILNKGWKQIDMEGNAILNFCFLIFSVLLFAQWLKEPTSESILKEPLFWLNSMVLLFFSLSILYWFTYNYLPATNEIVRVYFEYILFYSNFIFYPMIGAVTYLLTKRNF